MPEDSNSQNHPQNRQQVLFHEIRHVFAAGIALAAGVEDAGPGEYSRAKSLISAWLDEDGVWCGEAAIMIEGAPEILQKSVAALAAYGPIAKVASYDGGGIKALFPVMRSSDTAKIRSLGGLSDRDLELCESFDGPPTLPAVCTLGTAHLELALGFSGMVKLAKLLSRVQKARVEDLPLSTLIPREHAESALGLAKKDIITALGNTRQHKYQIKKGSS